MNEEKKIFTIKKIAGPTEGGAAIFLENEVKTFVIFVGWMEAIAIVKEISKQSTLRPLAHDLLNNILVGFDIELKEVIISKIVNETFCATLVLEQKISDSDGNWTGKYHRVYVDSRASDSIILALKNKLPIWVTKEVYEQVEDAPALFKEEKKSSNFWKETDLGDMDFKIHENDELDDENDYDDK